MWERGVEEDQKEMEDVIKSNMRKKSVSEEDAGDVVELSGSVSLGRPTPNSWERKQRRRRNTNNSNFI